MTQRGSSPESRPEYAEDVAILLSGMYVPKPTANSYINFLQGSELGADDEVRYGALALGRLYFASLSIHSDKIYSHQESIMLGLVIGSTIRDDPLPIKRAAADYIEYHQGSASMKQRYEQFFASGVRKLRERAEASPRVFSTGHKELHKTIEKFGMAPQKSATKARKKPKS